RILLDDLELRALGFGRRAAINRHEARAEAVEAGEVLVAISLVDLPLAPEFCFERLDRHAVALVRAVAAAFADRVVDHHALGRIGEGAALAAAGPLGGAGLGGYAAGGARVS